MIYHVSLNKFLKGFDWHVIIDIDINFKVEQFFSKIWRESLFSKFELFCVRKSLWSSSLPKLDWMMRTRRNKWKRIGFRSHDWLGFAFIESGWFFFPELEHYCEIKFNLFSLNVSKGLLDHNIIEVLASDLFSVTRGSFKHFSQLLYGHSFTQFLGNLIIMENKILSSSCWYWLKRNYHHRKDRISYWYHPWIHGFLASKW